MPIRVSTKVEQAWYVDPELLAGEEGEPPPAPDKFEIDTEGPLPRDMTVSLGEGDLEELADGLNTDDEEARHYRDVSLRGALLVNDGLASTEPSWSERILGRLRGTISRRQLPLSEDRTESTPPPMPPGLSESAPEGSPLKTPAAKPPFIASMARIFEPGRVSPVLLAAVSFFAGVITTLLGVLLAL